MFAKRKLVWLAGIGLLVVGIVITAVLLLHKTVTLSVDGESRRVSTYALTVGGLLQAEGIALDPADTLSPAVHHWLNRGETVTVEHAVPVLITADGKTHTLLTADRRPVELLAQAGVALQSGDVLLSGGLPIAPRRSAAARGGAQPASPPRGYFYIAIRKRGRDPAFSRRNGE